MKLPKTAAAAQLLLAARKSGAPIPSLPEEYMPVDGAEAYEIQEYVAEALGPVGGWKVGAKGPGMPPSCASLPAALMYRSRASLSAHAYGMRGIEAEIAVRLDRDLPPRDEPYSVDEVMASVGSIHPAIEIVTSRFSAQADPLAGLADSLSNGGFVYGEGRSTQLAIDQTTQAVELYFDDRKVAAAVGGNPAGDIWPLLAWLANHVAEWCDGLRAGQIITTGSCTGLLLADPGTRIRAVFPGLGEVELAFDQAAPQT
ncbi:2-keto-4-pentenoate hydratase [Noviherbaspirillum massiliense]|uniref:2-keto-4-pentenoate hydratase n=1 Tax=Noviherbaspirillum massiliense TaxID=1465823 RepID=UPI00055E8A94|nr:fumarylacetoacetate hydrolase family protein [Noviherbaspirillum massiliense]